MCQLFLGKNSELQKDVYPGCDRLFMRGFRSRSSLKSDPRVFPLLSVVLFLFFFKLTRVFSRGPHPAKAPRRTREKTSGTRDKRCWVKQMFFRMADMSFVELYFILLFFLFWRKKFVYFLFANHAMKIFRPFRQLLKGSKTTEVKQPHPQDVLFVVSIFWRFTVEVILPNIANVIGESGIWANQNRWNMEWILSGVMFRSCPSVFKYVSRSRISGLRLGHEFTFLFFVV